MLRRLEQEYPTDSRVLILLGETCQAVGDVEGAEAAYEKCLQYYPTSVNAGAALGVLHYQRGDTNAGERVFNTLLDRTEHGVNSYRTIGSTLARSGFFDPALRYYREGRKRNQGNYILTLDVAYLLRSMGDHTGSLEEYLQLIESVPSQHRLAKNRIIEMLRDPTSPRNDLMNVLVKDEKRNAPYRGVVRSILATAYLESGRLELALEMALGADDDTTNGTVLFSLANQTVEEYNRLEMPMKARYFDLALRALDAFLENYPSSPQVPRAKIMLIDLLVDVAAGRVRGHATLPVGATTDRALEALDWLITSFPGTDYAEEAYLRKGDVVFRIQEKPEEALRIYQEGMRNARFFRPRFAERLGRVYLTIERYDEASRHFATLIASGNQELSETGIFYAGLLLSFTGHYESARDTLTALADGNPSSQYTNDAIDLAWAIEEGLKGRQEVLKGYVIALRAELAQDTTRAVTELENIVRLGKETELRPRSLMRLSELREAGGDHDGAIEALEAFINDYPKHTQVPDAHRRIGHIYEIGYGRTDVALETYEDILLMFPHYLFLDEVRADVNRLRAEIGEK